MKLGRREFIGVSVAGLAAAQNKKLPRGADRPAPPPPVVHKANVTRLFKSPDGFPNALDSAPEGIWIGDQVTDRAHLVDLNGKVLRVVQTESHNTSGMGVGGGYIWMAANGRPEPSRPVKINRSNDEVVQSDMDGKTITRHEVPMGGGGIHDVKWDNGKLWIMSTRLNAIIQTDPKTWQPLFMLPVTRNRPHGLAIDNGSMWCVFGDDNEPSICKLDMTTGRVTEILELAKTDPDPHGLCMHKGQLYYCDAGLHPGWVDGTSKWSGWIARVDVV
jgi:hypothetical protein